jgi:hypothetical protein
MRPGLGLVCLLAISASACGPTDNAPRRVLPECAAVWIKGADLPKNYSGCRVGSKELKARILVDCRDSGGPISYGFDVSEGFLAANPGQKIVFYPTGERSGHQTAYSFSCDAP